MRKQDFLKAEEVTSISEAVMEAELNTSGEIKVVVVKQSCATFTLALLKFFRSIYQFLLRKATTQTERRAEKEFYEMGIDDTEDSTGVLIMISEEEHLVVVKADKAINEKVPQGTWNSVVSMVLSGIKNGKTGQGICTAVQLSGALLSKDFPIKEGDVNEISNEVEFK